MNRGRMNVVILFFCLTFAAISLTHCDADRSIRLLKGLKHRRSIINRNPKKLKIIKHFDFNPSIYSSNAQPYSISSPLSLAPYESLAPIPLPENNPPYCVYPPPSTPSIIIPTPTGSQPILPSPPYYYNSPDLPTQNPPPTPTTITPGPPANLPTPTPEIVPSPPSSNIPSPPSSSIPGSPEPIFNPPIIFPGPPESSTSPPYFEPSPPYYEPTPPLMPSPIDGTIPSPPNTFPSPGGDTVPSPPNTFPSPGGDTVPSPPSTFPSPSGGTVPSPTVFQPPVVYPPPSVPPPPNMAPQTTLWCVAKASVPDPIIEEAMNYACWSGADCTSIQPNGPCFQPDSVFAHASYAFNSYWQRTKASGGTCEFGGTAILVSVDPSYDGCHFIYN